MLPLFPLQPALEIGIGQYYLWGMATEFCKLRGTPGQRSAHIYVAIATAVPPSKITHIKKDALCGHFSDHIVCRKRKMSGRKRDTVCNLMITDI